MVKSKEESCKTICPSGLKTELPTNRHMGASGFTCYKYPPADIAGHSC